MNEPSPISNVETQSLDVGQLVAGLLGAQESRIYDKVSLAVDRIVIETVLRHVRGNQVAASQLLGISRTTLRSKMKALGLAVEKQVQSEM